LIVLTAKVSNCLKKKSYENWNIDLMKAWPAGDKDVFSQLA